MLQADSKSAQLKQGLNGVTRGSRVSRDRKVWFGEFELRDGADSFLSSCLTLIHSTYFTGFYSWKSYRNGKPESVCVSVSPICATNKELNLIS